MSKYAVCIVLEWYWITDILSITCILFLLTFRAIYKVFHKLKNPMFHLVKLSLDSRCDVLFAFIVLFLAHCALFLAFLLVEFSFFFSFLSFCFISFVSCFLLLAFCFVLPGLCFLLVCTLQICFFNGLYGSVLWLLVTVYVN